MRTYYKCHHGEDHVLHSVYAYYKQPYLLLKEREIQAKVHSLKLDMGYDPHKHQFDYVTEITHSYIYF